MLFLRHEYGTASGKSQAGRKAFPEAGRELKEFAGPEAILIDVEAPHGVVMLDESGAVAHELHCDRTFVHILLAIVPDRGRPNRGRRPDQEQGREQETASSAQIKLFAFVSLLFAPFDQDDPDFLIFPAARHAVGRG